MERVRHAAIVALVLVVALGATAPATSPSWVTRVARAATVAWPTSTLVVSEVQTGGASASDEFVEIANQGSGPVDLIGLEVIYATSSGSTVTRKATWATSLVLEPGRRVLLVNGAGALATAGDAVYSGGFAATGGAVALRIVGGSVVDAVGWGDATNAFVEGSVAPAPAAGSSLERWPGGVSGNGADTNDNIADWFVANPPSPQGLAAPPVPDPGPTPTAEPTPVADAAPTASRRRADDPPRQANRRRRRPPSRRRRRPPSPRRPPTPEPTPAPTAVPTAEPTPAPTAVAERRAHPGADALAHQHPDGAAGGHHRDRLRRGPRRSARSSPSVVS